MDRHTRELPKALVLQWNNSTLRARCPYCLYSHRHGLPRPLAHENVDQTQEGWTLRLLGNWRRSDCSDVNLGGEYILVFPQSHDLATRGYGWEVNEVGSGFVTVHGQGRVEIPINDCRDGRTILPQYQEQHSLSDNASETSSLTGATENLNLGSGVDGESPKPQPNKTYQEIMEELYLDPTYRHHSYISHCCLREIPELELLLRQYPADHFIGSVDEEGNSGTLLAATEEDGLETLCWLQNRGDPIDRANHYGRTPLMEAALWARLKTVQYLTCQSIDIEARDGNGMRALDLVVDTERNAKERRLRSAMYREAPDASRRREQIREMLKRLTSPNSSKPSDSAISSLPQARAFFNRKADGTLEVYRPQVLLQPPFGQNGLQKAFATLDRGPSYPPVNAMSGYSHPGWPNVLDNNFWTDKSEELRALLDLPENRQAASHVEPQLLAYLLNRHSLYAPANWGERRELLSVMPTYSLRPVISVSKSLFCPFCRELFERFRDRFPDLRVTLNCVGESAAAPLDVLE